MSDCVFCNLSKDRLIATPHNIRIIPTLGQITEGGYILLIPKKHSPCLGTLEKIQAISFDKVVRQTISILSKEFRDPITIFEHGIVGQTIKHSHLHIFPAKIDLTTRIVSDFPSSKIQIVDNFAQLRTLFRTRREPYLLWSTFYDKYLVCWNPPAPAQYLRTISAELLGVPERADWKKMDPGLDNFLIKETIDRLAPLFIAS